MAKLDIACIALFVNVISIDICPFRRENVPIISKPLPFSAGNHTIFGSVTVVVVAAPNPKMSPNNPLPAPPTDDMSVGALLVTPSYE